MDLGLRGKACIVTGSTGGIGLETASLLVAEGARVVTCGRSDAPGIGESLHV
ncbi:MAG: short chain dehydrogenase, partial [Gaiellaceae bacterium]|nr:short chain dehydrogenase [Gaiellaceae bacterium]